MHILDHEAPGLSDALKRLSLERRRRIIGNACNLVGTTLVDLEPDIRNLLKTIAAENSLTVAAIWNGFGGTSWSDAATAIYEVTKARGDASEIIAFVRAEVESA